MKKILLLLLGMALSLNACQGQNTDTVQEGRSLDKKVYVAVENDNEVAVVDPSSGVVLKRVDLPGMPHNVQVSPDGEMVWVTVNSMDAEEDQLIVISTETEQVIQTIKLGTDLHLAHVVLSPDNQWAYATAQEEGEIFVVNAKTYTLEKTIELPEGAEPHGLRLNAGGNLAYIALMGSKGMGILNLGTEALEMVNFEDAVVQTGVTLDGKWAFASLYSSKQLGLYNIETKLVSKVILPEAKGPVQVYATPDSRYVYVADQGFYFDQPTSDKIYKVDLESQEVVATILAGEGPHGVAISKDGSQVYVSNIVSGDLSVIDTKTDQVVKTIEIGEAPNGVSVWETPEYEEATELPLASSTSIVELNDGDSYNLEASFVKKEIDGSVYKMLAYNGSIPGPTLKVQQGSIITVNFTNNTNIETTLHSHGVRLDNDFDGVPDVTQKPIQTGESFTYQMDFDDAGVFWYHPHLREDYAQDMGLYGNYIVVSGPEDEWSPVNREETLIVDDILIDDGSIVPYSSQEVTHTLMGRFGNTMLVNGSSDYSLNVKKGELLRFYITNTANTRVFKLSIPDAQIKLVGADNGLYERDQWADEVLLGPSERAIVEVLFPESGEFSLVHKTPEKTYTMGKFLVSEEAVTQSYAYDFSTLKTHQSTITSIDPYRDNFTSEPDRFLTIDLDMKSMGGMHSMHGGMMSDGEPIEWEDTMSMMNSISNTDTVEWQLVDEETEKINEEIDDWNFKQGDLVKIRISNPDDTTHPMQHPIHIHGQRFLVLSTDDELSDNLVWKDTVLIPAGGTVDLLVEMSNPGDWMLHCHIPEHLESGMMMPFKVSSL